MKVGSSLCAQFHNEDEKYGVKVTSGKPEAKAFLIVVYWDKTSKDARGKFMMHGVYVGLAQLEPDARHTWLGKRHIGFLPIPKLNSWSVPNSIKANKLNSSVRRFGRRLYQYSLRYMLEPLAYYQHQGLKFSDHNGVVTHIVPRLFHFSGDLPEAAAALGVYIINTKLKMPCHICYCPIEDLCKHNIKGNSPYPRRKPQHLQRILSQQRTLKEIDEELKQYSLYPEASALFGLYHPNIHFAFAVDLLHMMDVGLSKDIYALIIRWIDGKEILVDKSHEAQVQIAEQASAFAQENERRVKQNLPKLRPPRRKARKNASVYLQELDSRARSIDAFPGM